MQSTYMTYRTYGFEAVFQYKKMNNTHIINFFNCWYTQYILFAVFPQRQINLKCLHGSWDRIVTCQPTDCGFPDQSYIYHAIFSCPWGTTFGKQCSFTCRPPAILQGQLCRCWNVLILIAAVPVTVLSSEPVRSWESDHPCCSVSISSISRWFGIPFRQKCIQRVILCHFDLTKQVFWLRKMYFTFTN